MAERLCTLAHRPSTEERVRPTPPSCDQLPDPKASLYATGRLCYQDCRFVRIPLLPRSRRRGLLLPGRVAPSQNGGQDPLSQQWETFSCSSSSAQVDQRGSDFSWQGNRTRDRLRLGVSPSRLGLWSSANGSALISRGPSCTQKIERAGSLFLLPLTRFPAHLNTMSAPVATKKEDDRASIDKAASDDFGSQEGIDPETAFLKIPWSYKWFALLLTCFLPIGQNCESSLEFPLSGQNWR